MKFLSRKTVMATTGLGNTSLYAPHLGFPRPIKLGRKSVWVEQEVLDWMAKRVAERDDALAIEAGRAAVREARK